MGDWGQGAQGAAGGAAMGTALMPGIGTAIGAGLGGIAGFLGGGGEKDEYQAMLKKLMAGYKNQTAPQGGPAAQAGPSSLVGNRGALISQLEAMARGEGPSAARLQMQEGMDRAVAAQASNAAGAGGRGVNAGAAMRNAGNQSAAIMSQGNRDMGVVRAQEQANAVGQLGQNINAGIGQDNQLSQWNAGATNSRDDLNLQLQMQMLGLTNQSQLQALQLGMGNASPGLGTSIMAGGASAVPGILQMRQAGQQQAGGPGGWYPQWGNYQGPAPAPAGGGNTWMDKFMSNNGIPTK